MMDADLARQLLERGFYLIEAPPAGTAPETAPKPRQPPAASARIS